MRMLPTRYAAPKPTKAKPGDATQIAHISAPLKGLNLSSKMSVGDPLTAPILTNFLVEDDRITCRSGTKKLATMTGSPPIERLVPYYGPNQRLAAAGGGNLFNILDGSVIKGGFTTNDWSWTSFANLGQQKFTVMCNGSNGVWSWDGSVVPVTDPGPVAVTKLDKTNPAALTVAAGDIAKFRAGMAVVIAGATTDMTAANGTHAVFSVNTGTNIFTLAGVDLSAAAAAQTAGITADPPPPSGFVKEWVTAPPSEPWIVPDQFNIVLGHMNRLFFADNTNLAVYYLPLQSKTGEVKVLPLNALFKRGGTVRAMYSWTLEGGIGINDQLVIFSSNGEAVIYAGSDPDTDFQLVGIFRFDAPMSKHSIINFGGDLYVLISTGLVPMSTLLRAESEQLGQIDKSVISLFQAESQKYRARAGWEVFVNPSSNRVICNIPQGSPNRYMQAVRHMQKPVWSQYEGLPARCWGWLDPYAYFADDVGNVYQMSKDFLSDDGKPIKVDVQMAWSQFKTSAIKHFKMVQVYTRTDGRLKPFIDVKTDYDVTPPEMQPDVSLGTVGSTWDLAEWATDANEATTGASWAMGPTPQSMWNGVGRLGRVGAPRLTALVKDCEFAITGFDVVMETGAAI